MSPDSAAQQLLVMICLVTAVVSSMTNANNPIASPRIIGGRDAVSGEIPWHVSHRRKPMGDGISILGTDHCTGAIIHERWILTAGHCALGFIERNLQLVYSTSELYDQLLKKGDPGLIAEVDSIHVNPNYTDRVEGKDEYDIALYHISAPMVLDGTKARAVKLTGTEGASDASFTDPPPGTRVKVAGFGMTGQFWFAKKLQVVELEVVERDRCAAKYPGDLVMCTYSVNGSSSVKQSPCEGDSGAGLVKPVDNGVGANESAVLVAVASFIVTTRHDVCGVGLAGYTRVEPHLAWIRSLGVPI